MQKDTQGISEENTEETNEETTEETCSPKSEHPNESDAAKEEQLLKFGKIMNDFITDLKTTFPEFENKLTIHYDEDNNLKTKYLLEHCTRVYPERFFDFLYKNESIINDDNINTEFLPALDLNDIWSLEGITENTKDTIWKYLQLILFSIIGDMDDKKGFGNTSQLFEAINQDQLKEKMEDTMKDLFELFNNKDTKPDGNTDVDDDNAVPDGETSTNTEGPEFLNPENMQEHISSLLGGKLGKLATEIAEETANDFDIDIENTTDSQDVMKQLFSNPKKLMDLVKNVGGKLDSKIKSGDIKESELMAEAGEIMKKMKDMPGMKNMGDLFKNMGVPGGDMSAILKTMGMPGMGKNTKLNMGAMNSRMKKEEAKDRIRKKAKESVQKRNEEKHAQEEFEKKKKEFMENDTFDVDQIMKDLELTNNVEVVQQKKKKKKKSKK